MSSNIFNKKGLTIRFNNLRLNLIKSLKDRDTDVHELKDSLEGMYLKSVMVTIVCTKVFMQRIWAFKKHTLTCEKVQLKSIKGIISLISSITIIFHSNEKRFLTEI